MSDFRIDQQVHGYRNGHQKLAATIKLAREDQDTVDRLSDMAGPLSPGEIFKPYLTMYPLPERSHYVIARTWQDLSAPRAGCVITRSLFIPMALWSEDGHLRRFLNYIETPELEVAPLETDLMPEVDSTIPPVSDHRTVELVEALFLEVRKPVVVFDASEPETTAMRLLTAAWPSLRRAFSICSWALAPRRISGRDFDLVFSPKSARARFGDWNGRRIDIGSPELSRHRWSNITAQHIFGDTRPSLTSLDVLGVLKGDQRGDESALRLSLLWNELTVKAATNPTAILGMLDILNSQGAMGAGGYDALSPHLDSAVNASLDILNENDAWQFLATLTDKFPKQLPKVAASLIERASATLTARNVPAAVRFFGKQFEESRTLSIALISGFAKGFCELEYADDLSLRQLPYAYLAPLLSISRSFTERILGIAKREPDNWIGPLVASLSSADKELKRKARTNVLNYLNDGIFSPLLAPLLEGVSSKELVDAALSIGSVTHFSIPQFDEALANAARDSESVNDLRRAIIDQYDSEEADRLILATLTFDQRDIAWLSEVRPMDRANRILIRLLEITNDRALIAAQRDTMMRDLILHQLSNSLPSSAVQLARILMFSGIPVEKLMRMGMRVRQHLPPEGQREFSTFLLSRAFAEADSGEVDFRELLDDAQLETHHLIQIATPDEASASRINRNLVQLAGSPHVQRGIADHVDFLSERLVRRDGRRLSAQGYEAWAELISQSSNKKAQFRAASLALAFALKKTDWPVSSLIVASFPIVYEELLRSKEGDERNIPAFLSLPMSFFVDWDRAKSARHDLVDAFKSSTWPPEHLLLTAERSDILDETIERLLRSHAGREYINKLSSSLSYLSPSGQKQVEKSFRKYT